MNIYSKYTLCYYDLIYESKVSGHDGQEIAADNQCSQAAPYSAPPSFRSRASSSTSDGRGNAFLDVETTLADTFDDGDVSGGEDDGRDVRQRLMRQPSTTRTIQSNTVDRPQGPQRRIIETPQLVAPNPSMQVPGTTLFGTLSSSNDGVFANLDAKPESGEKLEEQPPVRYCSPISLYYQTDTELMQSYEQAAADATPPYWETTILAPGMVSDEVYVDGLPVGSLFSFAWNGVISMSFNFVGFLLTYLLHTTHAAKNGSRAGLGVTLVQYGFYMKNSASRKYRDTNPRFGQPTDPNSHDFDPSTLSDSAAAAAVATAADSQLDGNNGASARGLATTEWLAYILMIAGWFVLIRAVTDFIKARRHEQLVLQSPNRGLQVPVVAEAENPETVV